jgi:hypothetical protein
VVEFTEKHEFCDDRTWDTRRRLSIWSSCMRGTDCSMYFTRRHSPLYAPIGIPSSADLPCLNSLMATNSLLNFALRSRHTHPNVPSLWTEQRRKIKFPILSSVHSSRGPFRERDSFICSFTSTSRF